MPETGQIDGITLYDPTNPPLRTVNSELGKNEFLKLFITRLRYQDPMSPAKDEEFIAQLAQFSTLEQLNNINETLASGMGLSDELAPLGTLTDIHDRLEENLQYNMFLSQTINNTMAAALIGRTVKWQAETINLAESGSIDVHYLLPADAETVVAKIYDDQGNIVRLLSTGTVSAGEHKFEWDGKDNDGNRLAAGNYTIEVTAFDDSGEQTTAMTFFKGKVDGVQYIEGMAFLNVDDVLVPLAVITEISAG